MLGNISFIVPTASDISKYRSDISLFWILEGHEEVAVTAIQAPLRIHCCLAIFMELEMKKPSSTSFRKSSLIWNKQAALWESWSLISPIDLTHLNLQCYKLIVDFLTNISQFLNLKSSVTKQVVSKSTTGDCTLIMAHHTVQFTLPVQLTSLFCGMVWDQSSYCEYKQDKGYYIEL